MRGARRWLNVAEWVVRRLGGEEIGELSLASRTGLLDLGAREPFADALAWTGLRADLLPALAVAGTPAGTVGDGLAGARGATLAVAGHDHLVAGVGVGVIAPGDVLDSCGTAEALVRVVAPPLAAEQVRRAVGDGPVTVGWHVAPDRQALLGGIWSGLVLQEVLDALGAGQAGRPELDAGALAIAPGDAPVLELDLRSLARGPCTFPPASRPSSCGAARSRPWRTGPRRSSPTSTPWPARAARSS